MVVEYLSKQGYQVANTPPHSAGHPPLWGPTSQPDHAADPVPGVPALSVRDVLGEWHCGEGSEVGAPGDECAHCRSTLD